MILYNVTISVDSNIAEEWLQWMKTIHIPEVMALGIFESHSMFKVLLQDEENLTFSIQYFTQSMASLQQYIAKFAPDMQSKLIERYGVKVAAFRTVLESV